MRLDPKSEQLRKSVTQLDLKSEQLEYMATSASLTEVKLWKRTNSSGGDRILFELDIPNMEVVNTKVYTVV